jgi:hypothetical protein
MFKSSDSDSDNFTSFNVWINDHAGTSMSGTYEFNPVPIPAAIWLLGSGLLGLAGLNRKYKKV